MVKNFKYERYEVLTEAPLRIHHLWDVTLCCSVNGSLYSEGTHCLHFQGSSSPRRILHSFQMLETTHKATQCHISDNLNPQIKRYSCNKKTWERGSEPNVRMLPHYLCTTSMAMAITHNSMSPD